MIDEKIRAMDNEKFEMALKIEKERRAWEKASFRARFVYTEADHKIREKKAESCFNQLIASHFVFRELSAKRDEYAQAVCRYSKFNSLFIVDVIAALISIYQGEEYVVRHATYYLKEKAGKTHNEECCNNNIIHPLIIVNKEYDAQEYFKGENDLAELEENGKAIVLRKQEYVWMHNGISFYTEAEHIDLSSISYVQDFVDGVIEYKLQHKLDVIDEETLINLLLAYVEANFEHIVENRKKAISCQEVSSKEEISAQIIKKLKNKSGD